MNNLIIFLFFTMAFSFANAYGDLSVELDKQIVSPIDDPVNIKVKLDYVPQDNFVYVQIIDPRGNSDLEREFPVDSNGAFGFVFAGDISNGIFFPLYEGTYVIKVTGMKNNNTVTDTDSFILHIKQKPVEPVEKNNEQNNVTVIGVITMIFFITVAALILILKKHITNRNNSKSELDNNK